jgi:hypothetical protein
MSKQSAARGAVSPQGVPFEALVAAPFCTRGEIRALQGILPEDTPEYVRDGFEGEVFLYFSLWCLWCRGSFREKASAFFTLLRITANAGTERSRQVPGSEWERIRGLWTDWNDQFVTLESIRESLEAVRTREEFLALAETLPDPKAQAMLAAIVSTRLASPTPGEGERNVDA